MQLVLLSQTYVCLFVKDECLFGSPNKTRQQQKSENGDFPLLNSPNRSPFASGKVLCRWNNVYICKIKAAMIIRAS